MIAKRLIISACVILALGATDSFAAASIRAGTVGATGGAGTSARAGSLRVGSGASLSSKPVTTSNASTTGTDSDRMAILPIGSPKVTTKPKLPTGGTVVVSGDVNLDDVWAGINAADSKAADAQSAAAAAQSAAGSAQTDAAEAKETAQSAADAVALKASQSDVDTLSNTVTTLTTNLNTKLDKPTGIVSGKVLKSDGNGGVSWADDEKGNVQLASFGNQLYYCGKSNGGTCDKANQSDGWTNSGLSAVAGADGKTAWLRKGATHIEACYKANQADCTDGDYTSNNVVALADIKGADGENGQPGQPGTPGVTPWLRQGATHIEACYKANQADCTDGDYTSNQVVKLTDIKGADGQNGQNGSNGAPACGGDIKIDSGTAVDGGILYELYCDE